MRIRHSKTLSLTFNLKVDWMLIWNDDSTHLLVSILIEFICFTERSFRIPFYQSILPSLLNALVKTFRISVKIRISVILSGEADDSKFFQVDIIRIYTSLETVIKSMLRRKLAYACISISRCACWPCGSRRISGGVTCRERKRTKSRHLDEKVRL